MHETWFTETWWTDGFYNVSTNIEHLECLDGCLGQTVCDMRGSVMFGYVLVSPSSWFLWALLCLEENNVAQSAVLRVLAQYTAQSRCALLRKQHYESTAKLVMAGSNQGQPLQNTQTSDLSMFQTKNSYWNLRTLRLLNPAPGGGNLSKAGVDQLFHLPSWPARLEQNVATATLRESDL